MFDVGAPELLLIVIVAILVIGPKDMPMALRTAGRWIGKMRRMSNHFRSGVETMIREAEMEEMEKKWQEQNRKVMEQHPAQETPPQITAANAAGEDFVPPLPVGPYMGPEDDDPVLPEPPAASAEARVKPATPAEPDQSVSGAEPGKSASES